VKSELAIAWQVSLHETENGVISDVKYRSNLDQAAPKSRFVTFPASLVEFDQDCFVNFTDVYIYSAWVCCIYCSNYYLLRATGFSVGEKLHAPQPNAIVSS